MNNYEINEDTLAVIGIGPNETKVLEEDREYLISQSAFEIMDHSCKYFGSSYQGRVEGAKAMLMANYKLPVIVEESTKMIFFPTESPSLENCIWISLQHYDFLKKYVDKTEIYFKNGKKIITNISASSINNQVLRSTRLESILNYRKKQQKD